MLIGRRELLKKYGVEVPPYENERPFLDEHRNVTYIANAGVLVAMVVTAYTPEEKQSKNSKGLKKTVCPFLCVLLTLILHQTVLQATTVYT